MVQLLYSHPRFHVIHKTAPQSFHSEEGPGLFETIKAQLGESLWPVHRLDKVTTGLLLVARDAEACAALCALFAEHRVQKCYLALADKKPAKKQGWVKGDMAKGRRGAWILQRSQDNPAVTRFDSASLAPNLRLYRLWPKTGRTHQLRVAMKSLGSPILGDSLYGGSAHSRVCLHAFALAFHAFGEDFAFEAGPDFLAQQQLPAPF